MTRADGIAASCREQASAELAEVYNKTGIDLSMLPPIMTAEQLAPGIGITTGGLFMMVGLLYERSHSRDIAKNLGLGKYMPAFMFFWGLFSLASFGFPGTNGFVGEILVFLGAFKANLIVGLLLVPGALLSTAYMFRVGLKMAWGEPSSAKTWKDLCPREWAFLLIPAVMVFYIGLAPALFFGAITPSAEKLLSDHQARAAIVAEHADLIGSIMPAAIPAKN